MSLAARMARYVSAEALEPQKKEVLVFETKNLNFRPTPEDQPRFSHAFKTLPELQEILTSLTYHKLESRQTNSPVLELMQGPFPSEFEVHETTGETTPANGDTWELIQIFGLSTEEQQAIKEFVQEQGKQRETESRRPFNYGSSFSHFVKNTPHGFAVISRKTKKSLSMAITASAALRVCRKLNAKAADPAIQALWEHLDTEKGNPYITVRDVRVTSPDEDADTPAGKRQQIQGTLTLEATVDGKVQTLSPVNYTFEREETRIPSPGEHTAPHSTETVKLTYKGTSDLPYSKTSEAVLQQLKKFPHFKSSEK